MQDKPTIGVICDHSTSVLAGRIRGAGYRIVTVRPADLNPDSVPKVDAWVIDCGDNEEAADAMEWLEPRVLALSNRPDLDDLEAYRNWCDRIIRTLDKWNADFWHAASIGSATSPDAVASVRGVWILAGSTGGVNAISEFLGALRHIPPVAFIYAQHMKANQQKLLTAIGHANRQLVCSMAVGRHWLNPGHLLIVPAANQLAFTSRGEVYSLRDGWETPETPSIDQLMMTMSGMKTAPTGAIQFSGAGRDGVEGLKALSGVGTRIWAQDPASAAAPSMPESVIEAGLASLTGSPLELAAKFMALYPEQTL